jgi:hypothetical protein
MRSSDMNHKLYGDAHNNIPNIGYIATLAGIELHQKAVYNYTAQYDASSQN